MHSGRAKQSAHSVTKATKTRMSNDCRITDWFNVEQLKSFGRHVRKVHGLSELHDPQIPVSQIIPRIGFFQTEKHCRPGLLVLS